MASGSDPITSHVLDQTSGTPAEGIAVLLTLRPPDPGTAKEDGFQFIGHTAPGSGRITHWQPMSGGASTLANLMASLKEKAPVRDWELKFLTHEYWAKKNIKSFYPEVVVCFNTDFSEGRDHWHVPLLLGPHGYTTYRGT